MFVNVLILLKVKRDKFRRQTDRHITTIINTSIIQCIKKKNDYKKQQHLPECVEIEPSPGRGKLSIKSRYKTNNIGNLRAFPESCNTCHQIPPYW